MSGSTPQVPLGPKTVKQAREAGLLIDAIPLEQIDPDYLVRDRLVQDEEEMASLKVSIQARGQQTPIEVAPPIDGSDRYGLISGWRRFMALRALYAATGDPRFATVRATVIAPQTAQDAYLTMIEENEIRVNLSFYERARIAHRAVQEGVFPDIRAALRTLYASSTRSKRSKIGTFTTLVDRFDGVLQHPTLISEKLGLAIARELVRNPRFAEEVSTHLRTRSIRSPQDELRTLSQAINVSQNAPGTPGLSRENRSDQVRVTRVKSRTETIGDVKLHYHPKKSAVSLTGDDIDEAFLEDLMRWLEDKLKSR